MLIHIHSQFVATIIQEVYSSGTVVQYIKLYLLHVFIHRYINGTVFFFFNKSHGVLCHEAHNLMSRSK